MSRPFDRDRRGVVLGKGPGPSCSKSLPRPRPRRGHDLRRGAGRRHQLRGRPPRAGPPGPVRCKTCWKRSCPHCWATGPTIPVIHAHGLSTRTCDADESRAIQAVCGGRRLTGAGGGREGPFWQPRGRRRDGGTRCQPARPSSRPPFPSSTTSRPTPSVRWRWSVTVPCRRATALSISASPRKARPQPYWCGGPATEPCYLRLPSPIGRPHAGALLLQPRRSGSHPQCDR